MKATLEGLRIAESVVADCLAILKERTGVDYGHVRLDCSADGAKWSTYVVGGTWTGEMDTWQQALEEQVGGDKAIQSLKMDIAKAQVAIDRIRERQQRAAQDRAGGAPGGGGLARD